MALALHEQIEPLTLESIELLPHPVHALGAVQLGHGIGQVHELLGAQAFEWVAPIGRRCLQDRVAQPADHRIQPGLCRLGMRLGRRPYAQRHGLFHGIRKELLIPKGRRGSGVDHPPPRAVMDRTLQRSDVSRGPRFGAAHQVVPFTGLHHGPAPPVCDLVQIDRRLVAAGDAVGHQVDRVPSSGNECLGARPHDAGQHLVCFVETDNGRVELGHVDLAHVVLEDQIGRVETALELMSVLNPVQRAVVPDREAHARGIFNGLFLRIERHVATEAVLVEGLRSPLALAARIRQDHDPPAFAVLVPHDGDFIHQTDGCDGPSLSRPDLCQVRLKGRVAGETRHGIRPHQGPRRRGQVGSL